MQTNMSDLIMQEEQVCSLSPQRDPVQRRLDSQWDYVSSPVSRIGHPDINDITVLNMSTRSQSVNMAMADYSDCYHGQTALQQMSQDMENQSTQPSSITSRQSSADYDTNPRVCSNDKFSAKFEAPVKISDSQKYKLAAEQVYQDQRSSSSFMSKLNS